MVAVIGEKIEPGEGQIPDGFRFHIETVKPERYEAFIVDMGPAGFMVSAGMAREKDTFPTACHACEGRHPGLIMNPRRDSWSP